MYKYVKGCEDPLSEWYKNSYWNTLSREVDRSCVNGKLSNEENVSWEPQDQFQLSGGLHINKHEKLDFQILGCLYERWSDQNSKALTA